MLAHGPVELLGALALHHPLTVGGIRDDDAPIRGQAHAGGVRLAEFDQPVHSRLFRVGDGDADALGIVVGAQDAVASVEFPILRLLPGALPDLLRDRGPVLGGEAAAETGGPVQGDEGRLDDQGAGAAEGIPKVFPAPVAGKIHHGRGHGLVQGRFVGHGPVAALMQAQAGGIQEKLTDVFHNGEAQLIDAARLRQPVQPVMGAQPIRRRLLDDALAVGHAVQLT